MACTTSKSDITMVHGAELSVQHHALMATLDFEVGHKIKLTSQVEKIMNK